MLASNIVAIAEIDTRRLTRILREKGALSGCLMAGERVDEVGCPGAGAKILLALRAWTSPKKSRSATATRGAKVAGP